MSPSQLQADLFSLLTSLFFPLLQNVSQVVERTLCLKGWIGLFSQSQKNTENKREV